MVSAITFSSGRIYFAGRTIFLREALYCFFSEKESVFCIPGKKLFRILRSLVFRGEKILQFCADKLINCLQKFVSPAAFWNKRNDCVFFRKDHRYLGVFSIRPERIIFTTPEKITIVSNISCLCTFFYPFLRQYLFSIPLAFIKIKQSKFVKLRKGQE